MTNEIDRDFGFDFYSMNIREQEKVNADYRICQLSSIRNP